MAAPTGPTEPEKSTFEATPSPVQWLVGGLTAAVNAFAGEPRPATPPPSGPPIRPSELLEGVRADYEERAYLWTGDIDASLYDADCLFTDPTLSFRGLDRFQRNIASLTPVLDALVKERSVELYSCELDEASSQVRATWRMRGDIGLPWRPAIDLTGSTVFTFDAARGNRIVDYAESWDLPASAALGQLLWPKRATAAAPEPLESDETAVRCGGRED